MAQVLRALLREPDGDRCIGTVFLYLQRVSKVPELELRMAMDEVIGNPLVEDILFPGRRLERELRKAKREVRDAKLEGERTMLQRLLGQRFGALSPNVLALVDGATSSELEAMALRVLTAKTLDEVLGKPTKRKRR